jgi:hypothetical protein
VSHREAFALAAFSVSLFLATSRESLSQHSIQPELLNTRPGVKYVGDEACRGCHPGVFQTFKQTGMGRSASLPSTGDARVRLSGKQPGREYSSFAKDGRFFHAITQRNPDGKEVYSEVHEVKYVVGSGDHARGYVFARGDAFFMSPISYYSDVHRWDLSPGYAAGVFRDFARPVAPFCAYCHMGRPRHKAGTINRYEDPPFRSLASQQPLLRACFDTKRPLKENHATQNEFCKVLAQLFTMAHLVAPTASEAAACRLLPSRPPAPGWRKTRAPAVPDSLPCRAPTGSGQAHPLATA